MDKFEFKKVNGGYSLKKYNGEEEKVIIPDTFKGEHVVMIGKNAFANNYNSSLINEIVLPKYLIAIKESAFLECDELTCINLPESLREIMQFAFMGCSSLEEIVFPSSLEKVGPFAFSFCPSLTRVTALSESTKFSKTAFQTETHLEEVSFSVLKSLLLPMQTELFSDLILKFDTLTENEQNEIKEYLKNKPILRKELFFTGNIDIINFILELKVKISLETLEDYIEFSIEKENTILTAYLLDYKNKTYTKSHLKSQRERKEQIEIGFEKPTIKELKEKWTVKEKADYITITGYYGKSKTQTLPATLNNGKPIKVIEHDRETNFKTLNTLQLPEGLEVIGRTAFCQTSIEKINIPSTVKEIGEQAFSETLITEITLPNTQTKVVDGLFWSSKKLEKVVLPDTIKEICSNAFNGCMMLTQINFPDGLNTIGEGAFHRCHKLKSINLPDSVSFIEVCGFSDCFDLEEIRLPKELKILKRNVFLNCCSLKRVILTNECIEIDKEAFLHCNLLEFVGVDGGENLLRGII